MQKFYLTFLLMISGTMVIMPSVKAISENNEKHQPFTVSEQGYSISLPDEYTLQKEEDGKDILFSNKTPYTWMRIEVLSGKESTSKSYLNRSKKLFDNQFGKSLKTSSKPLFIQPVLFASTTESKKETAKLYVLRETKGHPALKITMVTAKNSNDEKKLISIVNSVKTHE
ncbi:hypothetical protein ACLHDF_17080 [Priestia aryabhattai]|uniref:hypothetical protein n=1 Tax=Priestia megaterium TaxID=1404 RepID=UPI0039B8BB87